MISPRQQVSSAPWFMVDAGALPAEPNGTLVLDADESHHAVAALRIRPGDTITVMDGAGTVARCSVDAIDGGLVVGRVLDRENVAPSSPSVIVYTGAAKGSKVDGVIERLAELGIAQVTVYLSERAVVNWDEPKRARLQARWASIARSAAKQSRGPFLMATGGPLTWAEMIEAVAREPLVLALWEEASAPMRTALAKPSERVALLIGPEGGLSPAEAQELKDVGAHLVSLGSRILRTENAPVVAASAVLFHFGLIG